MINIADIIEGLGKHTDLQCNNINNLKFNFRHFPFYKESLSPYFSSPFPILLFSPLVSQEQLPLFLTQQFHDFGSYPQIQLLVSFCILSLNFKITLCVCGEGVVMEIG